MSNKYIIKKDSVPENEEGTSLNFEVFNVFADPDLYPDSFNSSKRSKILSKHPTAKMVTECRVTHPYYKDPIVVFKYKKKVTFEAALKKCKSMEKRAKRELAGTVADYENKVQRYKSNRKYGNGRISKNDTQQKGGK